jgi:hypoxanthine-DNA glycosylase
MVTVSPKNPLVLKSFAPLVDRRSRVLILGSMPGPEALRKQQYYGFDGNHFWAIIPALFNIPRPVDYEDKIALVKANRIALWDVLRSCMRPTALDSDIRCAEVNDIPGLLERYPNIRAVFINGQFAFKTFQKNFQDRVERPIFCLPSTSPANAAMSLKEKTRRWAAILEYLV